MISITSYYGSSAAKENKAKKVTIGNFTLYFSFETLIAVKENENLRAIKNYWGAETKEHLNAIDGGTPEAVENRLDEDVFQTYVNSLKLLSKA